MKLAGLFLLVSFLFVLRSSGQTRYLVSFSDKQNSPFELTNPDAFLSAAAVERRELHQLTIDSLDLPVNPAYIDSILSLTGVTLLNRSRWLNRISIRVTNPAVLDTINAFPFVTSSMDIAARKKSGRITDPKASTLLPASPNRTQDDALDYGASAAQIDMHYGRFLHNMGLLGDNIQVGMLDGGYRNYPLIAALDSLRLQGRLLETWDLVSGNSTVEDDVQHGLQCLSIIAGNLPGQFVGSAPHAEMLLYRTEESATEYPIEEFNWVCGAERADSAGADLISSSLGYGYGFGDPAYDNSYADLDGRTTIAAQGAVIAARKGLALFNAAGNEGADSWHYILTPADTDSLIAVAGVSRDSSVASFSSYGPSADGRIKPDVASIGAGTVLVNSNNTVGASNGTSYACPNIAGLAACLWQGFPEVNNMSLLNAIRRAGDHYDQPDDRTGYGIPDMRKAFLMLVPAIAAVEVTQNGCVANLSWNSRDVSGMRYRIERQLPGESGFSTWNQVDASSSTVLSNHQYALADRIESGAGTVRYRVWQVVDTANLHYLEGLIAAPVSMNTDGNCEPNNPIPLQLFGNPVRNEPLKVLIYTPGESLDIRIQVCDVLGRVLKEVKTGKFRGTLIYPLSLPAMSSGVYLLSVYDAGKQLGVLPFVKQ